MTSRLKSQMTAFDRSPFVIKFDIARCGFFANLRGQVKLPPSSGASVCMLMVRLDEATFITIDTTKSDSPFEQTTFIRYSAKINLSE